MHKMSIFFILTLGAALLLTSCSKEGPRGPTGPTGPSLGGSISGHVKLFDKYGSQVLTGLANVNLFLNGSATPQKPDATTGYYLFNTVSGVPMTTGIYSISASDSSYATTQKNNIQLVTGALNVDIRLSATPDSFVNNFHAYYNAGSANDSLVLTLSADSRTRYCIVFANNTAAVGHLPATYKWSKVISAAGGAPVIAFTVPGQDLINAGMTSGAKVYYAAYSYVVNDASVYEDLGTGQNVYNAVSTNAVADSTLVP
jgi:hypothetical protein